MPAIITDQFRIMNAETFAKSVTGIGTTSNFYYTFLGHPNPTNVSIENYGDADWSQIPPEPRDSFQQENLYHDSMLFLKRVNANDIARVVPRVDWSSGTTYDMYKNSYDIDNKSSQAGATTLYESRFYVVNSEYKVYVCINNGSDPDNPDGRKSTQEPNFVNTVPAPAGNGSDGYLWKYLYTITPANIVKFATEKYMPLPLVWGDANTETVKNAAVRGEIQTVTIKNRGSGYGIDPNGATTGTVANVPILGDGTGGEVSITITGGEVTNIEVTDGGSGYTRGLINFNQTSDGSKDVTAVATEAQFEVQIPPNGGHGADIYRELGSYRVMVYSKYDSTEDYIVGNTFSRVGIVKNPTVHGSQTDILNSSTATSLGALKLKPVGAGNTSDVQYPVNAEIRQTVGGGNTAVGYVASWSPLTGVLRYYQPVGLTTIGNNQFRQFDFIGKNTVDNTGVGETVRCATLPAGQTALISDASFNGASVNNGTKNVQLGQTFTEGKANPEIEMYSGEVIYIDNRAPITRSASQKEEVKIVVEF